jgi:hypothetical protein
LATEKDEIAVRVKAMTKSGVNFWKLPAINNKIWYTKENILRNSKMPLQITIWGSVHVPEIEYCEDAFL